LKIIESPGYVQSAQIQLDSLQNTQGMYRVHKLYKVPSNILLI